MNYHLHKFRIDSHTANGHDHKVSGCVDEAFGTGSLHFHTFLGVSSYRNHTHYFSGVTGPPLKTEHGHVHKIEGMLEMNNVHEHSYNGLTFEELSYIPRRKLNESFA